MLTDVSVDISGMVVSGGVGTSGHEEEEEDEDCSGREKDDEEDETDIDDINHTKLSKETVQGHKPTVRGLNAPVWTDVKGFGNHDFPGCGMDGECTHICIYPISDEEADGSQRFCNTPMKLFRNGKNKSGSWNTSVVTKHFKHPVSTSVEKNSFLCVFILAELKKKARTKERKMSGIVYYNGESES